MDTICSAKTWMIEEMKRAKVGSPVLTVDLLLAHVLMWDRVRVLSHPEHPIGQESKSRLRELVRRCAEGEPLQYLTGEREFYGLSFHVTPAVLIPRPETEIMVEKALELAGRLFPARMKFADVGTGSGCIAISFAHEYPGSIGCAVDLSASALKIAKENARRHGVEGRILMVQSDLLECFPRKPCFNLILCNPPYIALKDCDSLPASVREFEPHEALFGGESGLEVYRRLIPEIPSRLENGGYMLLEVGAGQAEDVGSLVESLGLKLEMIAEDLNGIPRCLIGRKSLTEK